MSTLEQPYLGATPDPSAATRDAIGVARGGRVPLVETFYSLQGEGLRSGQATVFVRTAGCNCDCWFCDTDFRVRDGLTIEEIVDRIDAIRQGCEWVCLTGGEPTIHDLSPLCAKLRESGLKLQVETNGSRPRPEWSLDHITVSPKERQGARLDDWYLEHASEFKYVVDGGDDVAYALEHRRRHAKPAFLQPNALNPAAAEMCVEAVLAHPRELRLSLQTHKLLDIR